MLSRYSVDATEPVQAGKIMPPEHYLSPPADSRFAYQAVDPAYAVVRTERDTLLHRLNDVVHVAPDMGASMFMGSCVTHERDPYSDEDIEDYFKYRINWGWLLTSDFTSKVHQKMNKAAEHLSTSVNPEKVAATVDLGAAEAVAPTSGGAAVAAGDDTSGAGEGIDGSMDKDDNDQGKLVGGVPNVGVLPGGQHSGRVWMSGKAGGTGMALVAALKDLASKMRGVLQNMGASLGEFVWGMRSMHGSLSRIATTFELESQQKALIAAAKARNLQIQNFKQEIEVIKLLKDAGGISEVEAQQRLQDITKALLLSAQPGNMAIIGATGVEEGVPHVEST